MHALPPLSAAQRGQVLDALDAARRYAHRWHRWRHTIDLEGEAALALCLAAVEHDQRPGYPWPVFWRLRLETHLSLLTRQIRPLAPLEVEPVAGTTVEQPDLTAISPDDRAWLIDRANGLTAAQIAASRGLSRRTVARRIEDARRRARMALSA